MMQHAPLQGHAAEAKQAQQLLLQAIVHGLVVLPHAAACLLCGKTASPWAPVLLGSTACPVAFSAKRQAGKCMLSWGPSNLSICINLDILAGWHQ